jgi:type I restriction enzyme R subunit
MENPEQKARKAIDEMLQQAGWLVQDVTRTNLDAGRGIAIREFPPLLSSWALSSA